MKRAIWNSDWLVGLAFCALFALAAHVGSPFYGLETAVYDRYMQFSYRQPSSDIAVIAIDEHSIDSIGRWPWTRDVLAAVIDRLHAGGARLIASTIFMSEPEIDPGLDSLRQLDAFYDASELGRHASDGSALATDLTALGDRLDRAVADLDYDARLAASVERAGNVILPLHVELGRATGVAPEPLDPYLLAPSLEARRDSASPGLEARRLAAPISALGERARAFGHLSLALDEDGSVRFEPLLVDHQRRRFPSLALAIAAQALRLPLESIDVRPGGIRLGDLDIATTPDLRMYSYFYADRGGVPAFQSDSFYDVFSERLPADKYRGKIVLIGASAAGIGDRVATPVSASMPPVLVLANTVSALLEQHFYLRPPWASGLEAVTLVFVALYLACVLPRLRAGTAALVTVAAVVSLLGAELVLMERMSVWLQLAVPTLMLLAGHVVLTVKRFGVTERLRQRADLERCESNRMLGLAFQSQGQLDLAFEKLRRCPLDATMMDLLYNLGLDYESKRQLGKAGAVYRYMADFDPSYRDVAQRIERTQDLSATLSPRPGAGDTLVAAGVAKPRLGRYVLEREIGHGAMGTVYLGRDPTINRVVAVKTVALSAEFDSEEVTAARERFFREAESAGRLNHPDIVTVYDAGEEHDVAYIAMEFLEGAHLNQYARGDNLLSPAEVVAIGARAAEALAFAHGQGIIHRDIKPANVMYNPATGEIKITDFGIARITDSTRTKTGVVLGTPSYMAPEQLTGKNVTGRSDLYSLGVTLYQLLSGALPFRADSMAALMFKIANGIYEPLAAVRPDLPACFARTIDRALMTDPERRYATGSEMARDLRDCGIQLMTGSEAEHTGHAA